MPRKRPYAEIAADLDATKRALSDTEICMSALADGRVQWLGGRGAARKAHTLALVRPESASGGWVIHVWRAPGQHGMVTCRTLDDFDQMTRAAITYSGDREEAYYLRSLCEEALLIRNAVLARAAG